MAMDEILATHESVFLSKLRLFLACSLAGAQSGISAQTVRAVMDSIAMLEEREADLANNSASTASASRDAPPGIDEKRGANRTTMAHISLLRGVDHATLEKLLSHCTFRDLAMDEVLLTAGRGNRNVYVLMSGSVRVHLDDLGGPPYVELSTGECVGEISILGDTKVTAHVIGNERARLMVIDTELLWRLIADSPELARNLLYTLSHRVGRDNFFLRKSLRRQRESEINANLDALTGLANRRGLDAFFVARVDECTTKGEPLSLLMVDIDHFKRFNDAYGHLLGDTVLCVVAGIFAENTAQGIAARYGGEEFALVLPGYDRQQAYDLANELRLKVREVQLHTTNGDEAIPPITISAGVAQMQAGDTPQSLILAADNALYCAKRNGRDCVMLHAAAPLGIDPL
jgi:diguanylate cyclase (GGDEF)-like protein